MGKGMTRKSEFLKGNMSQTVGLEKDMQTSLRSIANKAGEQKKYRFQNLYGMLDEHFLKVCFF